MNWYHPKRLLYNIKYWWTHPDIDVKRGSLIKFILVLR